MPSEGHRRLTEIAKKAKADLKAGVAPSSKKTTVRELLRWYGYARRGRHVVAQIRRSLSKLDLRTVPNFDSPFWIDQEISIEYHRRTAHDVADSTSTSDPTVRLGALDAAHRPVTVVDPDHTLSTAITVMMANDFSQVPATKDSRKIQGVVSWQSIGSRLALKRRTEFARDAMDPAQENHIDEPLLDVIHDIGKHGYTLARGDDQSITGIVTVDDVVQQFTQLAEPFLIIGEIEGYLRALIHTKFTSDDLKQATRDNNAATGVDELDFGSYCRLLSHEDRWNRLGLPLDRKSFVARLDTVREIRNDVMHFSPEGLEPEERQMLNRTVALFRDLRRMGVV